MINVGKQSAQALFNVQRGRSGLIIGPPPVAGPLVNAKYQASRFTTASIRATQSKTSSLKSCVLSTGNGPGVSARTSGLGKTTITMNSTVRFSVGTAPGIAGVEMVAITDRHAIPMVY